VSRPRRAGSLLILLTVLVAVLTHAFWLRWMAEYLIKADPPTTSDAIVVLAGDWSGERILKAAELAKAGYAPTVLVSGPMLLYGTNEAELAINYAVNHGYPRDLFVVMESHSFSTHDEAGYFRNALARRNIHGFLLVTSDFHTRRAGRIFRRLLGPGFDMHVIAAPYTQWDPKHWWEQREGQKVFFYEWTKTIASIVGL
jgi:uncharacterized SAM-binding protein YcdF (DUF218 family)